MKTKNLLLVGLGIMIFIGIFFSCQKDDDVQTELKGEAVFSFNSVSTKDKALKEGASIDDAAIIIISIRNADGDMVYELEQLPLIKMNESFITKPISLLIGDYELTQFIVADALGNALYIAPIEGSNNAYLVDIPLPIDFTISKDEVAKIVPEVVNADNGTPEDFGYTTVSFTVVETFNFLVRVFVYDTSIVNYALTTANLMVASEGITLYSNELEAITNDISIRDGYNNYIITIAKDGYEIFIDTIVNEELKQYYSSDDHGPLKVFLDEADCDCPSTVTDIDGNVYATVQIGNQCWMIENLKVTRYNDGTNISLVTENTEWTNLAFLGMGAYCWYDNDEITYKNTNGALYNWFTVNTGKLAPEGWHVPSDAEWAILTDYLGGEDVAGGKLKESGTTNWATPNTGATNESGFTALPSGYRYFDGSFQYFGNLGGWWSSTAQDDNLFGGAWYRSVWYNNTSGPKSGDAKEVGFSIRCIKD